MTACDNERGENMAIASVIQYEGDNTTFVWKHPTENFNMGSQLIVRESQEALFFMDGQALDLFPPGKHTLETKNIPLIGKLFSAAMGGDTPFPCQVYFINKTEQMAIKWGTDSRLEYVEPTYGFPLQIGASGEMTLRIEDSRKLLVKIVGTEKGINQQGLVQKLRAFLMLRVRNYLASYIKRERVKIFEIDEHLLNISEALYVQIAPDFGDYGISLEKFFVTNIVKPEDDSNYLRFRELYFRQYADIAEAKLRQQTDIINQETAKQRMILEAEGIAQKRALEGYTFQDERGFDVAERVASNEAVGQVNNLGMGLGMMAGVSSTVGGMVRNSISDVVDNAATPPTEICATCNHNLPASAKFCLECGTPVQVATASEIICGACGAGTPKGNFCLECGAPLAIKCTGCNAVIPTGSKFCLECGQKIKVSI